MGTDLDYRPFEPLDEVQAKASALLLDLHQRLLHSNSNTGMRGLLGRVVPGMSVAPERGIYFWGGVGRGKTHLMDWFVNELPLPGKERIHFHHFMREVHQQLQKLSGVSNPLKKVAAEYSKRCRVLCLDEFLVTDIGDAMLLYGLLDALFKQGVTLVTTSNTPPQRLYEHGLQRQSFLPAIDLILKYTQVFELDAGTDYRLNRLSREGVFWLEDTDTQQALQTVFADCAGKTPLSHDALTVNGRELAVIATAEPQVAWFDFEILCNSARAASDYMDLAQRFATVIVSGVPVLQGGYDAAARRFLLLVDEFYDQKVRLIMTTAAPIESLYQGGFVGFAWERLLSRLQEMQSEDYLQAVRQPDVSS